MKPKITIKKIKYSQWRGFVNGDFREEFIDRAAMSALEWATAMQSTGGGKAHKSERQDWIIKWLAQTGNFAADACSQSFHEDYHRKFPGYSKKQKFWGAEPVAQAQADLRAMAKDGLLESSRVGLGANWQPGFPKWVMGYTLPALRRELEQLKLQAPTQFPPLVIPGDSGERGC